MTLPSHVQTEFPMSGAVPLQKGMSRGDRSLYSGICITRDPCTVVVLQREDPVW